MKTEFKNNHRSIKLQIQSYLWSTLYFSDVRTHLAHVSHVCGGRKPSNHPISFQSSGSPVRLRLMQTFHGQPLHNLDKYYWCAASNITLRPASMASDVFFFKILPLAYHKWQQMVSNITTPHQALSQNRCSYIVYGLRFGRIHWMNRLRERVHVTQQFAGEADTRYNVYNSIWIVHSLVTFPNSTNQTLVV